MLMRDPHKESSKSNCKWNTFNVLQLSVVFGVPFYFVLPVNGQKYYSVSDLVGITLTAMLANLLRVFF